MRVIYIGLLWILSVLLSTQTNGQGIEASMTAKQYAYKDSLTQVDLYFKISTDRLVVREEDGIDFIDVNVALYLQEDGKEELAFGDRFSVTSNIKELTDQYMYVKQSFACKSGDYVFQIEMKDANDDFLPTVSKFEYTVDNKRELQVSDIFCYEKAIPAENDHIYYKSGFAIYPKFQTGNYLYNVHDSVLNYYVEFYDIASEKELFIERYVKGKSRNLAIKSTYAVKPFKPFKRKIESNSIRISDLVSGNYELVVTIFDSSKKQLVKALVPFQKISREKKTIEVANKKEQIRNLYKKALFEKHGLNNTHRLNQVIAAMALLEKKTERRTFYNVIDNSNVEEKENFFLNYWEEKDRLHPQLAIENFVNVFDAVQDKFAYRGQDGYKTEKGRVYLEYGKPDDVQRKSRDNNSIPYEIWHYYKLKSGQGNVIFVFRDANSSGQYELFHSNAAGELENPNWQNILQSIEGSVLGN